MIPEILLILRASILGGVAQNKNGIIRVFRTLGNKNRMEYMGQDILRKMLTQSRKKKLVPTRSSRYYYSQYAVLDLSCIRAGRVKISIYTKKQPNRFARMHEFCVFIIHVLIYEDLYSQCMPPYIYYGKIPYRVRGARPHTLSRVECMGRGPYIEQSRIPYIESLPTAEDLGCRSCTNFSDHVKPNSLHMCDTDKRL